MIGVRKTHRMHPSGLFLKGKKIGWSLAKHKAEILGISVKGKST